jgi:hypothetical protein
MTPPQAGKRDRTAATAGTRASQLGARAVAPATELNQGMGLSDGTTAAVLETVFRLRMSRVGLAQAFQRAARKAEPTYEKLVQQIGASPSVTPGGTGWKVGGCGAGLLPNRCRRSGLSRYRRRPSHPAINDRMATRSRE